MEKTTAINDEYREHIIWSNESNDFAEYGAMAQYCEGALALSACYAQLADSARWAEEELCAKSDAVAEHMEGLLYIDSLDPREQVQRLNRHQACSSSLRTNTDKVIRATDTKGVLPSSCCMQMFYWWNDRVRTIVAHCAGDYEHDIRRTMERHGASRGDVLAFALAEVDDSLGANPWGGLFLEHEDDLRTLVKRIHAQSGSHEGEALDELITLVAKRQWLKEQQEAEVSKTSEMATPTVSPTVSPTRFEEIVPDYLREGCLFEAWEKLVEAGYLTPDKKLAKTTKKVAAQYIVKCFCANRDSNEWSHFEKLWGISNLRADLGEPKKSDKEKIDKIFTFCN